MPIKLSQYTPNDHLPIYYGKHDTMQYVSTQDMSEKLNLKYTKHVQSVMGTLLYHSRSIEGTMILGLNDIGTEQGSSTAKIQQQAKRLMDYVATYPDAYINIYASGMLLSVDC